MTYDEFIGEWNTRQVTKYSGQCVALIAEYEAENNLPIVWGDAAAWVNNPVMLTHYNWIQNDPNDANQVPNRGDIIVWGADLPYTNGAGHIAFFDRAIDHQVFMTFGQNSGGPSAHFQEHSWAHVAGWYVSKNVVQPAPPPPPPEVVPIPVVVPPPAPPSAPVPFPGQGNPYTVIVPLQGYQSATAAGNHAGAATAVDEGEYFIFRYYPTNDKLINITKVKNSPGWWINADDNVLPPPPPPPEPTSVPVYVGPRESTPPEPVAEPESPVEADTTWKATYSQLRNDGKMVKYVALQDLVVPELSGKQPAKQLKKYQEIGIYGTFIKDQIKYWRPRLAGDPHFDLFYGVELMDANGDPTMEEEQSIYNPETTVAERKALHRSKPSDLPIVAIGTLERYLEDGVKFIDGIIRKRPGARKK